MRKGVTIGVILVAVILAFLLAGSVLPITGKVTLTGIKDITVNDLRCQDPDGDLLGRESLATKTSVVVGPTRGTNNRLYEDKCDSPTKITEYFCDVEARAKSRTIPCIGSCVDGTCPGG